MKRLTLIRHAKSSWKNSGLADVDRPLNSRGKRDAPRMGAYLARQGIQPDIILASPARRARKTAKLLAGEIPGAAGRILADPALYEAGAAVILERVRALDESWQHVMLIGHNPGLTDFANLLTAIGIDNLPTCAVLVADLDIDFWCETSPGCGRAALYVVPKEPPADFPDGTEK
jgi:phosphohistidine phosphatase